MMQNNKPAVPTPIPFRKISILGLILTANNTSIWMIFSFLPFMVSDFFPTLSKSELGFKAGIMGSAFSAGGLIGNILWGVISDKAGRRPALLCGLLGTAISALCFGFSPTFWFAVMSRFMWGLLNGNIGVAKTYLAEISDDSNSARGMALFGVIGGVGRTIGPMIGGFLSSPAKAYPSVFGGTIFEQFPYALPSLIVTVNCLVVLVIAYFELDETLQRRAKAVDSRSLSVATDSGAVRYVELNTSDDVDNGETVDSGDVRLVQLSNMSNKRNGDSGKRQVTFSNRVTVQVIGSSNRACSPLKQVRKDDSPLLPVAPAVAQSPLHVGDEESVESGGGSNSWADMRFSNGSEFNESLVNSTGSVWGNIKYLLSQREVLISTLLYGSNALALIAMTEIFPLWVVTPKSKGGFGYNAGTIGVSTMVCGVVAIFTQVSVYPMLVEWWGVLRVYRIGTCMFGIGCFLMPCVSLLNGLGSGVLTWMAVVAVSAVANISSSWVLICVFVLINNSCYSHQRATVNGIGQTFASLGRVSGPYLGAVAFAWSETNGLGWPVNFYFVWYLLAALAAINHNLAYLLPRNIQRRKREPRTLNYCGSAWEEVAREDVSLSRRGSGDGSSLEEQDMLRLVEEGSSHLILGAAPLGSADMEVPSSSYLAEQEPLNQQAYLIGDKAASQQSPTDSYSLLLMEQQQRSPQDGVEL